MLEIDLSKNPIVKVRVQVLDEEHEFETRVLKHEKDRVFLEIKNPKREYLYVLKEGLDTEITICSSNRIVKMNSLIIDINKDCICVELNQEYDVIQRRRYVRTKASYFVELKSDDMMFKAQTINLGGGGVCFIGNHCFSIGQTYKFKLLLPGHDDIIGDGVIINKIEMQDETLIMFNFSNIEKETRNKIIRFCFEKEFNA
ncbi:MAG: PilZ domain-containing protein [bacterium]